MNNCKICQDEIPMNHVQIGCCHMDCYYEPIELFKISLNGSSFIDSDFNINDIVENMTDDDILTIRKLNMTKGKYIHLSEFQGF